MGEVFFGALEASTTALDVPLLASDTVFPGSLSGRAGELLLAFAPDEPGTDEMVLGVHPEPAIRVFVSKGCFCEPDTFGRLLDDGELSEFNPCGGSDDVFSVVIENGVTLDVTAIPKAIEAVRFFPHWVSPNENALAPKNQGIP